MIEVCGTNEFFQLNETSNTENSDDDPSINPPVKLNLDPSQISSYSSYNNHTVLITLDGIVKAVGDNEDGKIGGTLQKEVHNHFTEFSIKDDQERVLTPSSSVCGYLYTLYKVSIPECDNKWQLAYFYSDTDMKQTLLLKTGSLNPISLFGGYENSAAIDTEGSIIFIPDYETSSEIFSSQFEPSFLPENEKAVKVCCCDNFIFALSSTGRVYFSGLPESGNKLNFSKVEELEGKEIIDVSGTCLHCLAVCKEGNVFAYGQNNCGQLGLGEQFGEVTKFTEIKDLSEYKIVAAYAGGVHSLFQTEGGKILACGSNNYLQIPVKNESSKNNFFSPIETTIDEGAKFCIAGDSMSAFFINCDPLNCPNKKITE